MENENVSEPQRLLLKLQRGCGLVMAMAAAMVDLAVDMAVDMAAMVDMVDMVDMVEVGAQ